MDIKKAIKKKIPFALKNEIRIIDDRIRLNAISKWHIAPYDQKRFCEGVNLIGPINQTSGLGQSCRLLEEAIQASGIPFETYDLDFSKGTYPDSLKFGINIIHINMHEFARAISILGEEKLSGKYNIAFWLWEMPEFPDEWIRLCGLVDEIWTPSEFCSLSIRSVTQKPVITMPYSVHAEVNNMLCRADFGLPDNKFLCMTMLDYNSCMERKNPYGVIDAFKMAFPQSREDVGIVVKAGNANDAQIDALKRKMQGYNLYIINGRLQKEDLNRLIQLCDVFVSLHRAEGFGLPIAEAMCVGTPVIATGYSANTEFQTDEDSCLVKYEIVELKKNIILYKRGSHWAEPDVKDAAKMIEELCTITDKRAYMAKTAECNIRRVLSIDNISGTIKKRIKEVLQNNYSDNKEGSK